MSAGHAAGQSLDYGLDEAIVPTDLNLMYAQDLREIANIHVRHDVRFTVIAGMISQSHLNKGTILYSSTIVHKNDLNVELKSDCSAETAIVIDQRGLAYAVHLLILQM